ncbi:hypothetical protein PHMEG_00038985 [Phytophthora megakarya]|uniref:Uncharacterized protein n=1 Tax=Phytophthora megakarya TaxID=4795 RepID=A0A225UGS2_9STRA|nr:hypothetical protein PHMEG_00038985 [Phytophthora megakarya]
MNNCSYAFEMQLLLHPNFKNPDGALKKVAVLSNLQAGASRQVAERHYSKIRRKVIDGLTHSRLRLGIVAPAPDAVFSEDPIDLYAETADEVVPQPAER